MIDLTGIAGVFTGNRKQPVPQNLGHYINTDQVLAKVVALPLSTWNYKSQDAAIRHIGPMAQDFKAAFSVGETDTGISTVDADGVALAAIQGLNQKLAETRAENAELRARLEKLEQLINATNRGGQ